MNDLLKELDPPTRQALHHEATGGAGPCLLLLHGMLSSRFQWTPNIAALTARARPVLLELWGHGLSPTPMHDNDYAVEAYVAEFERIRLLMDAREVVMIGQSFGAGLAMHYAIRHPDRVRALVITNSVSAFKDPGAATAHESLERMAREIDIGGAEAIKALPMHPRHAKRLPEELKALLVAAADAVDPVAVARSMRLTAPQASVHGQLERIACPLLLVNGRYEASFQNYRDVAQTGITRFEVVDLPAGHAVNLEAPAEFDRAVLDFLARVL